jgi:Zn-dependent protease/predicted transcriptional regulator
MMEPKKRQEIDLFKVAGVQIAIDYSWLIIFVLVLWSLSAGYFPELHPGYPGIEYWMVGLVATLLFFASIVIHELSHALVANHLGQPVERISLFIFGGMAHLGHEPTSARDELKIAAVGPLTSFVLGALFLAIPQVFGLNGSFPMWASVFDYLGFINVALGIFNLLPGFPLDGGRILRATFWSRSGDFRRATALASEWGRGIAYGLIFLGALEIFSGSLIGGIWLIFIALFLKGAASASYQSLVIEQVLGSERVSDLMVRDPLTIDAATTVADAIHDHFMRHGYGGYPVIENGRVAGLIALSQVRDCPAEERAHKRVSGIMRPLDPAIVIAPDAPVSNALRQMAEGDSGRLLVMEQDRLVGLLSRSRVAHFIMLRSQLGFTPPDGARSTGVPSTSAAA